MIEWLKSELSLGQVTLPFTLWELILRFLVPSVLVLLGGWVLGLILRRIAGKLIKDERRKEILFQWERRIRRLFVFLVILFIGISLFETGFWDAVKNMSQALKKPFFTTGDTRISVISLILILPLIALASWLGKLCGRSLGSERLKNFGLSSEQSFSLGRLIRYAVMVLTFVVGLSVIGINFSTIGVIFGVLGIGIGFGLQGVIADFFAGITLISMGLLKEGDRIQTSDGYTGIIKNMRLMNTELVTFENETLIIPNRTLTGNTIHNMSYKDSRVVIVNEVDVSYSSNLDDVIAIMLEVARRNPWRIGALEPFVRVRAFAESGITMQLRIWIGDVADRPEAFSWTNLEIWRAFLKHDIEIPFPQRVIHTVPPQESPNVTDSLHRDAALSSDTVRAHEDPVPDVRHARMGDSGPSETGETDGLDFDE